MLISSIQLLGSTSSGTLSQNTPAIRGICRHIIVSPQRENTIYSLRIVNPIGIEIYKRESETGVLSEILAMPVYGIYTVTVHNATSDESFIIQLVCEE